MVAQIPEPALCRPAPPSLRGYERDYNPLALRRASGHRAASAGWRPPPPRARLGRKGGFGIRKGDGTTARALGLATLVSLLGFALHNLREFGPAGLVALETGAIPVALVQLSAFLLWWRLPRARTPSAVRSTSMSWSFQRTIIRPWISRSARS